MTRVNLIQKDQAPPVLKSLYEKIEAKGASIHNAHKLLAHNPRVLRNFLRLGVSLLSETVLPPKLREMAIIRVARLTGSDYEWASHYPIALEMGVSEEQAAAVAHWSETELFNLEEAALLRYTDEVAGTGIVSDEAFEALRQHLAEQAIVELTLIIGFYRMVARFVIALEVEIDTGRESSLRGLLGEKSQALPDIT
jgi:AhpD family alkylhydroperoxidase